ncbi:DUF968 domain-containing protein [Actinobacillus equuli subsp. haemolyticus]|nr:DUF968 domain-containing protein [Actinobacillus equuli subsp. haemolyticus]
MKLIIGLMALIIFFWVVVLMSEAVLLTPYFQKEVGLVFYRIPPNVSSSLFGERTILMPAPERYQTAPSGKIAVAKNLQNSTACAELVAFAKSPITRKVLGGEKAIYKYVSSIKTCQCRDGEGCHREMTITQVDNGFVRTCWIHDHQAIEGNIEKDALNRLADNNWQYFVEQHIKKHLGIVAENPVNFGDLVAFAIVYKCTEALPYDALCRLLRIKNETQNEKESSTIPFEQANPRTELKKLVAPVLKLKADPEPPASFMAKPKEKRFESSKWLQFVKKQPCICCGQQADDPHHIIGQGRGRMGSKEHDLFVIPLCRIHHNELHRNPQLFERNYGNQTELLYRFLGRALSIEALSIV